MRFYFARGDYKSSLLILFGLPLDATSSFIPGSRFGPANIRTGAENIELYSPYFQRSLCEGEIYDAGDLIPEVPLFQFLSLVEDKISSFLADGKKVLSLGGEHTITYPCLKAFKRFYPNLLLLHLDAHSDMREEYLGERLCHATVIRRVQEFLGPENIFSFGIRSLTEECPTRHPNITLFRVLEPLKALKKNWGLRPVYLTLDCDVLDGSLFPAVSTPEPNGIFFDELLAAIREVSDLTLVGADIVEYNPQASPSLAYASAVALLVREVLLALTPNLKPKIC